MLRWSFTFLIIAIIAGILGLSGVAGAAVEIAKILFVVFLGLFALTLAGGLWAGHRLTHHGPPHV